MINLRNSMGLGWGQTRDPWMKKFNHLSNEFDFLEGSWNHEYFGSYLCAKVGTNLFSKF